MAGRHALLIGIGSYGEGLAAIPSARADVEALAEVLLDPGLGGLQPQHLRRLLDPSRTALASAIESFYADKQADDLLLLYFSGHGFRDDDRQLLLSSAESGKTRREGRVQVPRASTLTAAEVRGFMERSRARRQVVILDCCFSGAFAEGLQAKDEGLLELETLGGEGRAILTSSAAIETSRAPEDGEGLSVYTRFLVEGIRTGAADRRQQGWLDAEDLHLYSQSRVKELAPSMTPQFFPTRQGHSIRICNVRLVADVAYRQKLQELAEARGGKLSPVGRAILADLQEKLGLSEATAAQLEAEVLQPFRDYERKLERYSTAVQATLVADGIQANTLSAQDWLELKELEQRLKLRAADVAAIHDHLGLLQQEILEQKILEHDNQQPGRQQLELSAEAGESNRSRLPESDPNAAGPALIQISKISRGWLLRQGDQWLKKEEPITVPGYREELADGVALTMIQIPAGSFEMGSPANEAWRYDNESLQHPVRLSGFYLGQTPVTQAQWRVVAGWPKLELDLNPDPAKFKGANRPVEQVSWHEAVEYCQRLSQRTGRRYSLSSEAQWEYACRAGTATRIPIAFGESITPELANYDGNYTYADSPKGVYRKQTTAVETFPANAWGLQDMHGNVREWCLDHWHENYVSAPLDGTAWVSCGNHELRLLRGGSWGSFPRNCRSADRAPLQPVDAHGNVGFRVVCLPQDPSLNS